MTLMSTQERALINQRRRESYHVKKLLRIEEMEGKREYKCRMKECNNLHLDSIAMANPQFVPKLIFPTPIEPLTSESELVFPKFNGSPVYIPWIVEQTPDVQGTESGVGRNLPRRRVFHATIGKNRSCRYDADRCADQLSTESREGLYGAG
ncbi:hypothetical protein GQ55_4G132600 [Panicum hallii var. hallii]|uniref:Uncharacterized protein n=1 Tax=Panicum hallii var. hallii TaxID=1504633 RepID=A0A2T7DY37_9POAL|nr:hypothetical protein GQ55_4G132600 [Panicum hallii var. hallii]